MVSFVVIGADAVAASFQAAAAAVVAKKPEWLMSSGRLVEAGVAIEIGAQGLFETGRLQNSGRVFDLAFDSISVGFGHNLDYAQALERGASPHPIVATRASNLKFYWVKAGMWFLGPSVQHPGNRPYAYARNGAFTSSTWVALLVLSRLKAIFS